MLVLGLHDNERVTSINGHIIWYRGYICTGRGDSCWIPPEFRNSVVTFVKMFQKLCWRKSWAGPWPSDVAALGRRATFALYLKLSAWRSQISAECPQGPERAHSARRLLFVGVGVATGITGGKKKTLFCSWHEQVHREARGWIPVPD